MKYKPRTANAKICLCALIMALPASSLVDATVVYAQTVGDEEGTGSKSAIQSAIKSFGTRRQADNKAALETFYAARDYRPAWTGSPEASQRAVRVETMLKDAPAQGLDPGAYDLGAAAK